MTDGATRQQIVAAADQLFYRQGFEHTSFSHIAKVVQISRGNFYHHFKSKDEILEAVIEMRLANTEKMLEEWESLSDKPDLRIRCFIEIVITNWAQIEHYGCPVGSLTQELAKLNHGAHPRAAEVFTLFRNWLKRQFLALGKKQASDRLAMQVLSFSQGVATIASAFKDEKFVKQEVRRMCDWLDEQCLSA